MDIGQSFLRGIAGAYDLEADAIAALGPVLEEHLRKARAAWPGVVIRGEDFAEHLAACAPEAEDPGRALDEMHTTDLYLAYACSIGHRAAIEAFEETVMGRVPRAIARIDSSDEFISTIMEEVRIKLLVGDGRPPRIASYLGRGPLTSWVMVTATRAAYSAKRGKNRELPTPPEDLDVPMIEDDPELAQLREQVREPFVRAFREALASLDVRGRTVLRLYLIEEVSAETIGRMYSVHRATVARWIAKARRDVFVATKKQLSSELDLDSQAFESLMAKLLSGLDLSLSSFLETP